MKLELIISTLSNDAKKALTEIIAQLSNEQIINLNHKFKNPSIKKLVLKTIS